MNKIDLVYSSGSVEKSIVQQVIYSVFKSVAQPGPSRVGELPTRKTKMKEENEENLRKMRKTAGK